MLIDKVAVKAHYNSQEIYESEFGIDCFVLDNALWASCLKEKTYSLIHTYTLLEKRLGDIAKETKEYTSERYEIASKLCFIEERIKYAVFPAVRKFVRQRYGVRIKNLWKLLFICEGTVTYTYQMNHCDKEEFKLPTLQNIG